MGQSRLEIKIIKDKTSADVDIQAMSLEAAQAFVVLLESLTNIVELTPDNKSIKIQITSGSAVMAAEGEPVTKVQKEFDRILENKSANGELVEQWRRIQRVFTLNGLQYDACFYDGEIKTPIYSILRNRPKLRVKPLTHKTFKTDLEFITGKLIAVGGKNPNIHVEVDGKALSPISCTEMNATKAKAYLYQTIRFSAWSKMTSKGKQLTLCDSYANEESFEELKSFVKDFSSKGEIEALKKLHYQIRSYLDVQGYGKLHRFLRLFTHDGTDINILKIILIVTQTVRDNERIKQQIQTLHELFNKRFKQLNKKIEQGE